MAKVQRVFIIIEEIADGKFVDESIPEILSTYL